ncbi:MAG: GntR family transcriptional regulator [Bifidobacteriaceae bacterium]|nr:GntR family transcriptional regulator [Bifidobacteriaceae bacterium]
MSTTAVNSNNKAMTKKDLIVNTLAEQIEGGEIAPGERLDGEQALASKFHVSRGTVREALSELQRRHLISTRGGVGSVVIYDGRRLDQAAGWTASLSGISRDIVTNVLRIEPVDRADVPDLPDSAPGESFVLVARCRLATDPDGSPKAVSLELSHVPNAGFLASLPVRGLYQGSINASLRRAGLSGDCGEQKVSVSPLNPEEAAILGRPAGIPFLRTVRTSFTSDGRFVEHVVSLLDPDRFTVSSKFGEAQ